MVASIIAEASEESIGDVTPRDVQIPRKMWGRLAASNTISDSSRGGKGDDDIRDKNKIKIGIVGTRF